MKTRYTFLVLLGLSLSDVSFGTVRQVPSAYSTIQAAINASVNGDTVLVAPGTYQENIIFRGKQIVVTSHYAINADPSYIPGTIIDGSNPSNSDSGSVVRIVNGEDSTAVLQGFTLTGGHGTLWEDEHGQPNRYWEGGGILIALSSPTIRHNIIRNNNVNRTGGTSTGGGGIRLGDGAPRILNNIIINNAGMYGGGLVSNYAAPIVRNNIVAYNVVSPAVAGLPTYGGGGLWFNGNVQGNRIENNTIVGNSATGTGGSAGGRGGGLIAVFGATITTRNNIVWGNTQTTGAQLAAPGSVANVSYSDVEGGFAGVGNIDLNPTFADTSFYLMTGSPCIDAGDTAVAFNDREDPGNPGNALWPSRGVLRNDMGAYGGPRAAILNGFLTSVPDVGDKLTPQTFSLLQNYPNPFNPATIIEFQIPQSGFVSLRVFDVLGREVATLVDDAKSPGNYSVRWDATAAGSGTYFARLESNGKSQITKMLLIR